MRTGPILLAASGAETAASAAMLLLTHPLPRKARKTRLDRKSLACMAHLRGKFCGGQTQMLDQDDSQLLYYHTFVLRQRINPIRLAQVAATVRTDRARTANFRVPATTVLPLYELVKFIGFLTVGRMRVSSNKNEVVTRD